MQSIVILSVSEGTIFEEMNRILRFAQNDK